jgi:hypothetical protein
MTESPTNSDSALTAGSVKQKQKQKQKDVGTKPMTTKPAAAGVSKPRSRSGCHTCKAKHVGHVLITDWTQPNELMKLTCSAEMRRDKARMPRLYPQRLDMWWLPTRVQMVIQT